MYDDFFNRNKAVLHVWTIRHCSRKRSRYFDSICFSVIKMVTYS